MSLPNHYDNISPNVDPRPPAKRYITSEAQGYPGSIPYITPQYINNDRQVNKTHGDLTNGYVRCTIMTRTKDQPVINIHQFAFLDTDNPNRPKLLNIQELNQYLANNFHFNSEKDNNVNNYLLQFGNFTNINKEQAEKSAIMKRFKLFGVIANRDTDNGGYNSGSNYSIRDPRVFTCTVRGACEVLDYWSSKNNRLRAYDQCYFVLKKVKLDEKNTKFNKYLTKPHNVQETGKPLKVDATATEQIRWQIIPFSTSDSYIDVADYSWNEGTKTDPQMKIGGYWKLGCVHEYADIGSPAQFDKRGELSVAQNMSFLHDYGRVLPLQFYLNLDNNCN